jgi:nudix-type nucleoside diphosphatase (YffH/AdpP family)
MDRRDVKVFKTECLYDGFFQIKRYNLHHPMFDGTWSKLVAREVLERGPVAAVIPYDPIRDTVVLIEQFRPGPMAVNHPSPWMIEIVAGILEKNESPNELSYREPTEETGGSLSEVVPVYNFLWRPAVPPNIAICYVVGSIPRAWAAFTDISMKGKISVCSWNPQIKSLPGSQTARSTARFRSLRCSG